MEAHFVEIQKMYLPDELKKVEHQWFRYIELKSDYGEK